MVSLRQVLTQCFVLLDNAKYKTSKMMSCIICRTEQKVILRNRQMG